ncbi:hypothetical protein CKO49_03955 [Staphylococcus argenteus]|nr:hypothetical protein CKO49_03955 [Staphylococcus argenteus]KAA0802079.1 hypothetical protein DVU64_00050 [Staphylococcus argenteus]
MLGPHPQLALPVEIGGQFLYVGAPGIEISLLQVYFHSVNCCEYYIVEPRALIYVSCSFRLITYIFSTRSF